MCSCTLYAIGLSTFSEDLMGTRRAADAQASRFNLKFEFRDFYEIAT